jgi:hypothetical protein
MAKINEPTLSDIYDDLAARARLRFQKIEEYYGIPSPDNLDVHQFPIGRDIPVYHEYAFEARMPRGCDIANWGNEEGFKILEESIAGQIESISTPASGPIYDMIQLVKARRALDNGDRLSIKQIALLARMTEKSVSNALHANGDNRLKGASANKSDTLVENHEALCWLKGRRSFRETTFPKFDGQQPESLSHAEISKYIHDRLYSLYGGEEEKDYVDIAISQLGWEKDTQRLYDIFVNTSAIRPTDCEALASLIKVDAAWFTEQIMRALFPRQMDLSLKSALSNKHQVNEGNNGGAIS